MGSPRAGVPAGRRRALGCEDFEGRTALLSPFDRLAHDRVRAEELFEFEHTLEMYTPKALRRWGYFALPVLHHDRLVAKVGATADRKASVLEVRAIHEDAKFTRAIAKAVQAELDDLAKWLWARRGRASLVGPGRRRNDLGQPFRRAQAHEVSVACRASSSSQRPKIES